MDKQAVLAALTPEIVDKFRTAISLSKWEDGTRLTNEQRETCMQAVMLWEHEYLPQEERIGFIHRPKKESENCDIGHDHHYPNARGEALKAHAEEEDQPVRFRS